jgi:hypothetical protein
MSLKMLQTLTVHPAAVVTLTNEMGIQQILLATLVSDERQRRFSLLKNC